MCSVSMIFIYASDFCLFFFSFLFSSYHFQNEYCALYYNRFKRKKVYKPILKYQLEQELLSIILYLILSSLPQSPDQKLWPRFLILVKRQSAFEKFFRFKITQFSPHVCMCFCRHFASSLRFALYP